MKDLEVLSTNSALYGKQLEKQNRNNVFLYSKLRSIETNITHFKGYFNSVQSLNRYCPEKEEGDFAYVKKVLYCVEGLSWIETELTIDDFNFNAMSQPYIQQEIPVYYKGDSILVVIGKIADFENSSKIDARVFVSTNNIVKASTEQQQDTLQIRRDEFTDKVYFIIPNESSRTMDLGQQSLEVAAYFPSSVEDEEFVKRMRKIVFELQEFETL